MSASSQKKAPLEAALSKYRKKRIVSFDVPGHKQGKGNKTLTNFLGKDCLKYDVNSMKPLDNLIHPTGVIKEAEALAAKAFKASHAFFMVGGTTSAVQAMILSCCKTGDKIILPRNVHRSAINALILCGALPVYVDPDSHIELGIPLGMSLAALKTAIAENPDAKAVLVNNPTYYGVCSNLKEIVKLAHTADMVVLADEAHGTHFYFGDNLPAPAMACGADMSAVSIHKTGGSLTQSSLLLLGPSVNANYVRQIINLTQTTSASYLLMVSLDITRKNLALNGKKIFNKISSMANYAREEINNIGGYHAFAKDICNHDSCFDFDCTKLSIHTRNIGLAGIEVYDILRDTYDIQIEFGDIGNILAIISIGDSALAIERLIAALSEIRRLHQKDPIGMLKHEYIKPIIKLPPKKAFFGPKIAVPLSKSKNRICTEFVMCYPPGIPILAPGEEITTQVLEYILYAQKKGSSLMGTEDLSLKYINVLQE